MNKKLILLLITAAVSMYHMQSCQEIDTFYSCDKEANDWVKHNLEEVSNMTRSDWATVGDIVYQRAIYNAFSAEQRLGLWLEKLNTIPYLLSDEEEVHHIGLLISMLEGNINWFDDAVSEKDNDNFDLFVYKWVEYAISELGWNAETLYILIGTPHEVRVGESGKITVEEPSFSVGNTIKTRSEDGGGYGTVCDCGQESEYLHCPVIDGFQCKVNYSNPCRQTERGCGYLWRNACWGICTRY